MKKTMNMECNSKTCPWWGGYSLSSKYRKLIHNPDAILREYIDPDMWVLDAGCGMGFMAVPAAKAVGSSGRIIAADIQPEMLGEAMSRIKKAGLESRAVAIQCSQHSLCIEQFRGKIDFAYAFMMVHEVSSKENLLGDIFDALKPGGRLLVAEPYIHVSKRNFTETVELAKAVGFTVLSPKRKVRLCRAVLLEKQ